MAIGFFNAVCSFCPFRHEGKDDLCDIVAFIYYSILMTVSFHRTIVTGANHFSEPFKMTKLSLKKNCPSLIEFSTCQLISMSNIFLQKLYLAASFILDNTALCINSEAYHIYMDQLICKCPRNTAEHMGNTQNIPKVKWYRMCSREHGG